MACIHNVFDCQTGRRPGGAVCVVGQDVCLIIDVPVAVVIFLFYHLGMKHLSDADIEHMADMDFSPDTRAVNRAVRARLRLAQLIPSSPPAVSKHAVLDLHYKTQEQAWSEIMRLAASGVRSADIITGASGILKIKFQQWATDSILAPYIISIRPINNGSFFVRFRRAVVDPGADLTGPRL